MCGGYQVAQCYAKYAEKYIKFRTRLLHLHRSTSKRKGIFAGRGTADWRHKAARVLQEHSACDTKVLFCSKVETRTDFETWWTELQEEVDKWLEEAENRVVSDFKDTVAECRIFQAQEVNMSLARKNGRSWRFKLELEAPEPNMLEVLKTIDSGIGVGINSKTEDCCQRV